MSATDETAPVCLERDGALATVWLNRPHKLNALDGAAFVELHRIVDELEEAKGLRVVVFRGVGRAFSAGGDLNEVAGAASRDEILERASVVRKISALPQYTIAAVNGPCVGAAIGIAGACDARIMSSTAFVDTAYARLGLSGDFATTYVLVELIGAARAQDWLLFPRRVSAAEAERCGWAIAAADFDEDVRQRAQSIAALPHGLVDAIKANLADAARLELAAYLPVETRRHVMSKRMSSAPESRPH